MLTERNRLQSWLQWTTDGLRKAKPYHLFEHLIANMLVLLISFIVVVALYKLGEDVLSLLVSRAFDPLNIIQVKTVILVSMLALARKFIILDIHALEAAKIASLALALVALGAVYWLMRERDAWNMEHGRQEEG